MTASLREMIDLQLSGARQAFVNLRDKVIPKMREDNPIGAGYNRAIDDFEELLNIMIEKLEEPT